jgi:hypothetical protein
MRRKQEAGPGRSSCGPASSPLFTGVRGIGILRTSPFGDSPKFAIAPVHDRKGALAPHTSPLDATQGIVYMGDTSSKEHCVGLRTYVWCVRSKVCASVRCEKGKPVVRRGRKA